VLAEYHRRFKYILVDEYQDSNVAQYLWLRLLAQGKEVRAWMCKDYWLDIGRHDDYEQAQSEFDRMRDRLIPQE